MDLVVHIGLPKAGSTTIQKRVFWDTPGYLGTRDRERNDQDEELANEFFRMAPVAPSARVSDSRARSWTRRVLQLKEERWPSVDRIILSEEWLSRRKARSSCDAYPIGTNRRVRGFSSGSINWPIIAYLDDFARRYWTVGRVKVLFVLRNQAEWLASLYSQRSQFIRDASGGDFKRQVSELLSSSDDYLDWSRWVMELRETFGSEDVCILLVEDMGNCSMWKRMAEFAGVAGVDAEMLANGSTSKENVKRVSAASWAILPYRGLERCAPFYRGHQYTKRVIRRADVRIYRYWTGVRGRKRAKEMELDADFRERIRDHCRPFNQRLSDALDRDVEALGY